MRHIAYQSVAAAYTAAFRRSKTLAVTCQTNQPRTLSSLDLMLHLRRLPVHDRHLLAAELLRHGLRYTEVAGLLRYAA